MNTPIITLPLPSYINEHISLLFNMHISMLYFTLKEKTVFQEINIDVPITKPWLLSYFFLITLNLNHLSP